jgi:SAM-dependent methyltransferase
VPPQPPHAHWEHVYDTRRPDQVSWFEPAPATSLALIEEAGLNREAPIVDVGAGASLLAASLLRAGYTHITVLDVSATALAHARAALGHDADRVTWLQADALAGALPRRYALWHDRALFHFMVDPAERERYLSALRRGLQPDGHLVLATFGPHGPDKCNGLPVRRYDEQALQQLLGEDFELLGSRLHEHRTPSRAAQQFLYTRWQRRSPS